MAGKPKNTPSIQEQIENAKEGEIVHIPAGEYTEETITIPDGVILVGDVSDDGKTRNIMITANVKEGDAIQIDPQTEAMIVSENIKEPDPIKFKSHQAIKSNLNCIIAIQALDRISTIHDHPGSCSKNCPALIAQEALRKIRG